MSGSVRLRDGVQITVATGTTVACDSNGLSGDVNVLSHGHADHLASSATEPLVCSELTADLADLRRDDGGCTTTLEHPDIDLYPAGHIAGSRAARITDPQTGRTYLYTGDISTRSRLYLDGFRPPSADVLIIESTYGTPAYRFPPQSDLESAITDWLTETMDVPVALYGYSLGRAQKLQQLAANAARDRIFVTTDIARINRRLSAHLDVEFQSRVIEDEVDLEPGDALVLPPRSRRDSRLQALLAGTDAKRAGFSGWAVDSFFRFRGGYDATFPLSDHCDYTELVGVVEAVDPEVVYTHHGFAEKFAAELTRNHGYRAVALRRNQATLTEY